MSIRTHFRMQTTAVHTVRFFSKQYIRFIRRISNADYSCTSCTSCNLDYLSYISVPASPDQGHDRLCRRGVGRVFLAGVRPDSPSRRRIPSCYRPGPGRGVVVELGQRGAH